MKCFDNIVSKYSEKNLAAVHVIFILPISRKFHKNHVIFENITLEKVLKSANYFPGHFHNLF